MARGYERRLGARVLALRSRGGNISNQVAGAARRAIEGSASSQDIASLQEAIGESRSGASYLKGVFRTYNAVATPLANISRELDILTSAQATGQSKSAAEVRLVQVLTKETERIVKSKPMRNVLESVFKSVAQDPSGASKLVGALARGVRLGGVVGTVVAGGFALAESIVGGAKHYRETVSRIKDLNRAIGGDTAAAARFEKWTRSNVQSTTIIKPFWNGRYGGEFSDFLKDYLNDSMESQVAAEVEKEAVSRKKARANLGGLGIDANALLVAKAQKLGKSVVDLSPRERTEAIDDAISGRIRLDAGSAQVDAEMAKQTYWDQIHDWFLGDSAKRARRQQFAAEERRKKINTVAEQRRVREVQAAQAREQMTADDLFEERVMLEERQSTWMAYRSRRVAWSNDFY